MLGGLFKDFSGIFDDFKPGPRLRTITVAKPYCSPARQIITGALQPYGVKMYRYNEAVKMVGPREAIRGLLVSSGDLGETLSAMDPLPSAQVAEVTVSEKAAAWAEYLMLRTGKIYVVGRYVNKRNAEWASCHGGQMPPRWNKDQPWIEKSCSDGVQAWQSFIEKVKRK